MTSKRTKLWSSISAVTLAGAAGLSACSSVSEGGESGAAGEGEAAKSAVVEYSAASQGESEGEGEGEGQQAQGESEGEGGSALDLSTDDLAYLTQLGLIRGHLFVGYQLYKAGHIEHAKTHMKHPESELYSAIAPAFKIRGSKGFAAELAALHDAVKEESNKEDVDKAYEALTTAIAKNEGIVAKAKTPADKLKLASELLRVAGEEYALAVIEGKMENPHEYQDALGFTKVAKSIVMQLENQESKTKALGILEELEPLWPSLVPPETLSTEAGQLYGAASKIELLGLSITK